MTVHMFLYDNDMLHSQCFSGWILLNVEQTSYNAAFASTSGLKNSSINRTRYCTKKEKDSTPSC